VKPPVVAGQGSLKARDGWLGGKRCSGSASPQKESKTDAARHVKHGRKEVEKTSGTKNNWY